MKEITIKIRSVQDVLDFVSLATARAFRITVSDGRHQVNGKSFMEMFCLNARQPLKVSLDCGEEDFQRFLTDTEKFLVK